MRKLTIASLILFLSLGAVFITPAPVAAQATWCYEFDFSLGQQGWEAVPYSTGNYATWTGSGFAHGTDIEPIIIRRTFASATITQFDIVLNNPLPDDYGDRGTLYRPDAISNPSSVITQNNGSGPEYAVSIPEVITTGFMLGVDVHHGGSGVLENPSTITKSRLRGTGTNPFGEDNCPEEPPAGDLIRPLAQADELPNPPMFTNDIVSAIDPFTVNYPNMVYALSADTQAYVMAVADGQVIQIHPFQTARCSLVHGLFPGICFIGMPMDGPIPFLIFESSTMSMANIVLVQTPAGNIFEYYVRNADYYVSVGTEIHAGCVLGETIQFTPVLNNDRLGLLSTLMQFPLGIITALGLIPGGGEPIGITMVGLQGEGFYGYDPLIYDLTEYALPDEACNLDPRFTGCMVNNPQMKNMGDGWESNGDVTWSDVAAQLGANGYIYQQLNLSTGTEYTVSAVVYPTAQGLMPGYTSLVTLQIGNSREEFAVAAGGVAELTFTTTPSPDVGGAFYTAAVQNTGTADILVAGYCISEGGNSLVTNCTVNNSSFDTGLDGWTQTPADILWNAGHIWMFAGDGISQTVSLTTGEWVLEIEANVWGADGATGTAGIDIIWPGESTPESTFLDITWTNEGSLGYPDIPETIISTFTYEAGISGDLILTATATDQFIGVRIEKVCLHPADSGYDPPPFGATCSVISPPTNDTIGAWISYHWNQLNRFFQCELMILLNHIYSTMISFFKTVSYSIRWGMATINGTFTWTGNILLPWLNGHFANMAAGRVTYVDQGGGASVWDVLYALIEQIIAPIVDLLTRLINGAADILFTVVNGIVSIVFQFFAQLFDFLGMIQSLLNSVVVSFNTATPEVVPGLPNCSINPQGNLLCVGLWVMDNTIFSGPGALIIPLIISFASIHFIIWAVREIKKIFMSIGVV